MNQQNIFEKLSKIFHEVFTNPNIVLTASLTATDVDGWDSLTHMILIDEIETQFNIKFKLKELNKLKNVGDLLEIIELKLAS
ncbi:acyl carrier protein [Flavobacterium sp.]